MKGSRQYFRSVAVITFLVLRLLSVGKAFCPTQSTATTNYYSCIKPNYAGKGRCCTTILLAMTTDDTHHPRIVELDDIERVFCLSDLHTDHVENLKWVRDRMENDALGLNQNDLLVVAGDISHEMDVLEETLVVLREKCQVFFVPGNHEAWLHRKDPFDSLTKLQNVQDLCYKLSVHVDALYLKSTTHPLWILPLQSWYDGTLSFDESLCQNFKFWPWVDFLRCRWPSDRFPLMEAPNERIPAGLVEYFHQCINEPLLEAVVKWQQQQQQQQLDEMNSQKLNGDNASSSLPALMTVSHFLPNSQCLPDWIDLSADNFDGGEWLVHGAGEMSAKFAKVAGSSLLDQQIRSVSNNNILFGKHIHIFGHSHRPKDFRYNNIRYIHNPLGKPRERQMYMVSPEVDYQLVWDFREKGEVKGPRILRFWEEYGGGRDALRRRLERVRPGRYGRHRKPRI